MDPAVYFDSPTNIFALHKRGEEAIRRLVEERRIRADERAVEQQERVYGRDVQFVTERDPYAAPTSEDWVPVLVTTTVPFKRRKRYIAPVSAFSGTQLGLLGVKPPVRGMSGG